jgi:hypothetical protein
MVASISEVKSANRTVIKDNNLIKDENGNNTFEDIYYFKVYLQGVDNFSNGDSIVIRHKSKEHAVRAHQELIKQFERMEKSEIMNIETNIDSNLIKIREPRR